MSKEIAVQTKGLWVAYPGTEPILRDVTLSIPKGSITAIIGPNGSGKTTLLRALVGLIPAQKGKISVLGKSPKAVRHLVGYVPQRFAFDKTFPITVEEFLRFSHSDCEETRMREYLSHLRMEHAWNEQLSSLSGGQLQRVLVVRAILHDPEILYFDEPAAGIDVGGEQTFYELISHLHERHSNTVVMVSHEIDVVSRFADQVLCVNRSLLCQGEPQHVLTPEVLEQMFGKGAGIYHHHQE